VRGLSPYPAAWSELVTPGTDGAAGFGGSAGKGVTVKIFEAAAVSGGAGTTHATPAPVGAISTDGRSHIRVACGEGWVALEKLQLAGKKTLSAEELLRGFSIARYRFE
jgi:methionyl-tRNA formyltransferase